MNETITAILIGGKADGQQRALEAAVQTYQVVEYDGWSQTAIVRLYHRHQFVVDDCTLWLYVIDGMSLKDAVNAVFTWYVGTADRRR